MGFSQVSIQEWIDLPFHMMGEDWKVCMLDHLRKQYDHKVHPKYGAIREVHSVDKIIDNRIPPTLTVVKCLVAYTADVFLPREGEQYEGYVSDIKEIGIIITHDTTVKTLIQKDHLLPYTYNGTHFVRKGSTKVIKQGTRLRYTVIRIQKSPHAILCIAMLGTKQPKSALEFESKAPTH